MTDLNVQKLKGIFATKDDLNTIKEEMKKYATKEDIENSFEEFATRLFKVIVTKDDLKNFYTKDEMDAKFNQILSLVDRISKDNQTLEQEQQVLGNRVYQVHQPQLENHEARLKRIGA